MIRCVIIDDEPLAIDLLADHVSKTDDIILVGTFTNPMEGLQKLDALDVDLVFLDIRMPQLSGIQFLKIKKRKCQFVITTAYQKYAFEGFEHDVVDYLLKPISFERFLVSIERIKSRLQAQYNNSKTSEYIPDFIFVKSEYKTVKVNLSEIIYLEGMRDYVGIKLENKNKLILSLDTLKNILSKLPDKEFIRVHKSFIVNTKHIDHVERNRIIMKDKRIPVGATYLKDFQNFIKS